MGKVILGFTTSSDGFINDRNGSVESLYANLLDWRGTALEKMDVMETSVRTHLKFRVLK